MDSMEASRQRAEQRHEHCAAAGHNPCKPYTFACAEAARREIEVERVPKGDVRLYGGKAVYDADSLLIIHEQSDDPFTEAFLVAHELGHAELATGEAPWPATAVDPLQPVEAVPVGIVRVADYSHRQRLEVQMNVFARELLLPRKWMQKLHVEEKLTATQIASQCEAPFGVVVQQLLDALLLPPITVSEEPRTGDDSLTDEQAAAAQHDGTPFLLEAGPGTGKTKTLVARIEHLLGKGVDPSSILVLTFSNKAATELSERVSARHPEAVASIWIGTFHGFGLDLIRRFHDRLGLPADPMLLDRTDAIALLEDEYPKLDLHHFKNLWDPARPLADILAAVSRANDEVVDSDAYRALSQAMKDSANDEDEHTAADRCLEVAKVFKAYERIKATSGRVDFGDLVSMPVRLCESNDDVRDYLRGKYKHILVDEFQDVNRSSVRLLKGIAGDGRDLWVVGDVKQSIYRFRGASSFNVARFGHGDFPGGTRQRLLKNFRSVGEIVDAISTFASRMTSNSGSNDALEADRSTGGHKPEYRSVDTVREEVGAVAEAITEMQDAGHRFRDQAVLCSGNDRLSRLAADLERVGIPVLHLGNLFAREEVKDLLSLLSIIIDRRPMGLLRAAAMKEHAVPLEDVANLLTYVRERNLAPMEWCERLDEVADLSADGRTGLRRIAELLSGFEIGISPWEALAKILLDRSRKAAAWGSATDVCGQSQGIAVWQLMNFLRTQTGGSGLPIHRTLERIRRLALLSDERDLRQLPLAAQGIDAVRLMTMHGSKGLEFPVVHLPGLNEGSLPRSPGQLVARGIAPPNGMIEGSEGAGIDAVKAAMVEEQACLFFVALSRARDRLLMYSPVKNASGHRRRRSSFVDRLEGRILERHVTPSCEVPDGDDASIVPVTLESPFSISDRQLALYEKCPRRFLYTHILEIGGRRKETPLMKLHDAVQQVVDAVRELGGGGMSPEQVRAAFDVAWESNGPIDHGYADEYKSVGGQLIEYLVKHACGMDTSQPKELRFALDGGEIVLTPDLQVTGSGGETVLRKVRTGHKQSKEEESLAAAVFQLAASAMIPGCRVELVHLCDATVTPIAMSNQKVSNRGTKVGEIGKSVQAGEFPLNESIACPRCPAFFICGRLPAGSYTKK